jgi:serine protease Do
MRIHFTLPAAVLLGAALLLPLRGAAEPVPPAPPVATAPRAPTRDWSLRQTPVVDVIKRVRDAVVNIHSERTAMGPAAEELFALAPSQNRINGMGTGVVLDPRGYIVTNQHVVEDVHTIRVRLADGTLCSARVLAREHEADLALLKIDASRPLPTMPLGTSSDVMVGETVIAIGNAYGYEHTASTGIVSAVGRDVTLNKEVSYKSLIQTDAAINPGNSGGPLLNIYGDMIGINVAIRAGAQNIGFAIPVDTMIRVAAAMLGGRSPRNPFPTHGLVIKDVVGARDEGQSTKRREAEVERVESGTAAAKAGLQRGDVLVKVGDLAVSSSLDLERALVECAVGDKVPVVVRRAGAEQKLELVTETPVSRVVSGSLTASSGREGDLVWRKLGVRLQGVSADSVSRTHPQLHGGMLVADVRPDSAAGKAGIQRGDVLVGLHQWEMLTTENVLFVVNHPDLATFQPLRFYVLRSGQVHRGFLQGID